MYNVSYLVIDCLASRSRGDNVFDSTCLSICRSACPISRLFQVQQRAITPKFGAKKSHYQSKVFVCVSVISTDVVDWLSRLFMLMLFFTCMSGGNQESRKKQPPGITSDKAGCLHSDHTNTTFVNVYLRQLALYSTYDESS